MKFVMKYEYPAELPVSAARDEIASAVKRSQVVIVSGQTGSGKTTQLPKILLELGRGTHGKQIVHTQPRRIAARTVAERIASEMGVKLGDEVGYQVRFTDESSPGTRLRVVTDGILLAQIQRDPKLTRYDTIIIDEAHERSLNIDFLLGYLTALLPQRRDLKLIITSATIDSVKFQEHFEHALHEKVPVIEVSGRTFPVQVVYEPLGTAPALMREVPGFAVGARPGDADYDELASAILVTTSRELAEQVSAEAEQFVERLSRKEILRKSLDNYGYILVVDTLEDAIETANEIASEHLEIVTKNPFEVMMRVKNAGAIFIGEYSSEPLGDYFAGPNHVLPTNGTAKFFSPLGVDDFIKKSSIIYYSKEALEPIHKDIIAFAESERLTAHANSIRVRFEEEEQ